MKKSLIIGLATLAITGTALVASSLYAATGTGNMSSMGHMQRDPQSLIATLSGKVSPEAITAFTTLIARHKTEMDALKSSTGTTIDKATMEAKHEAFKTEIDALMTKYPDLKAALPTPPQGGKHGANPMTSILAGVSVVDKAAIETIHTDYDAREKILKTEEKAKIDAIIANYPAIKAKLDALKASKQVGDGDGEKDDGDNDGDRGGHGGQRGR